MLLKSATAALALAASMSLAAGPSAAANIAQFFAKHNAGSKQTVDHSAWDKLLKKYVKSDGTGLNRVDYGGFKAKDHKTLDAYIDRLQATKVQGLAKPEQFAFWVNLYNAKTIDVILDHYPIATIRKITIKEGLFGFIKQSVGAGGPWKAKIVKVAGQDLSLDDIEHGILRPIFRDPRVHYAVNCASIGCPNLRLAAFTGANLEKELDAGARDYINSPRGLAFRGGKTTASSIYKWFQEDFGGNQAGVIAHVKNYANDKVKAKLAKTRQIDDFAYDWGLNDVSK